MKVLTLFLLSIVLPVQDKHITGEISLTAEDAFGRKHTIVCGVHPEASGDFDVRLGELPVPPVPTDDIFDLRFLDLPGSREFHSTGSYMDIRGYNSDAQIDTFLVHISTESGAYPVRFSWPANLASICDSAMLIAPLEKRAQTIDMLRQFEWMMEGPGTGTAHIVRYGIRNAK